ncbi:hypothetical protein EDD18DRAFT_1105809 [Armillaria luteobubalina]|uniref:GDP/GTP exchange factor Sec2 N-terminal domain-containing protein n=1 Tax=Armillaria luteobubalina TaxID=153913 RepID=A0AA39UST4_9AGAR|nr:hypothetical protein EDD18DRAFT_1105809 [Armillaria luteobubalina]
MAADRHDEPTTNGMSSTHIDKPAGGRPRHGSESDAQEMVIQSLRIQIQDLYSQVTQLNAKLVKSYDRVSDLEDDLHVTSSNLRSSTLKVSELEFERTQHLSALNTGLLVEKSNVTAELNRLMEKATEEAAQRGQAETARATIEKELDDLSASLFDQANTMVAEARYSKALSERKVEEAEVALKGAEEAVALMQQQMQALQADKEEADKRALSIRVSMGKRKWVERRGDGSLQRPLRLISSHLPYQEFLLFVAHLRTLHTSTPTPPTMSTLLPLPFIARLLSEDSEPTVRLDLAPSLNWLSRRSVLAAIHNGQLTIEPISSNYLLQDAFSNAPTILGLTGNNIVCALCGEPVFPNSELRPSGSAGSWSSSLFKKPLSYPLNGSNSVLSSPINTKPTQVHIFRVSSSTSPSSALPSLSIPTTSFASTSSQSQTNNSGAHFTTNHHSSGSSQSTAAYPLCSGGWCLTRLRQTCTLWAFVRTGIVERIWEEEVPSLPPPPIPAASNGDKPPVPPRRRGLWGMASALGERAASWSGDDKEKKKLQLEKEKEKKPDQAWEHDQAKAVAQNESARGKKFTPPPVHPSLSAGPSNPSAVAPAPAPPPLPRRHDRRPVPPPPPGAAAAHETEPHDRPQTPTRVPLPESRPATPASPAAPPPLPRRAAARGARQLPGSRPGTPKLEGAAKEKMEEDEKKIHDNDREKEEANAKKDEETKAEAERESENVEKEVEHPVTEERPSTAEAPTTEPSEKPEPEPDVVAVEENFPSAPEGVEEVKPSSSEGNYSDAPSSPTPSHVNGRVDLGDRDVPPGYDDEHEKLESPVMSAPESDDEKEGPDDEDESKEVYIGDTTWEERTWKELVRIKEDMFWARVGGLR